MINAETPFDGGAGATNVVGYQYGILANKNGERFIDEGQGRYSLSYVLTKAVHRQPGRIAYVIADERVAKYIHSLGESQPETFDSISAIGDAYDIESDRLAEMMAEFSDAVQPREFDPDAPTAKGPTGFTHPKATGRFRSETTPTA